MVDPELDVAPWYERLLMMLWVVGSILDGGPRVRCSSDKSVC